MPLDNRLQDVTETQSSDILTGTLGNWGTGGGGGGQGQRNLFYWWGLWWKHDSQVLGALPNLAGF